MHFRTRNDADIVPEGHVVERGDEAHAHDMPWKLRRLGSPHLAEIEERFPQRNFRRRAFARMAGAKEWRTARSCYF
jgi:hypothetical protein